MNKNHANRRIILVRHAHRDKPNGHLEDNGLSVKGQLQSQALVSVLDSLITLSDPAPLVVWSSKKVRCLETLRPWLLTRSVKPVESDLLTEGQDLWASALEVKRSFDADDFAMKSTAVFCSHGDWIPLFVSLMTGKSLEIRKAGIIVLSSEDSYEWSVAQMIEPPTV